MELSLIKMLAYAFIGVTAALIIYITALALFLNFKIEELKNK